VDLNCSLALDKDQVTCCKLLVAHVGAELTIVF
jgi:hypothetical protein